MDPKLAERISDYQYIITATEFFSLLMVMLMLLILGFLVKSILIEKHGMVPIKWAFLMLVYAFACLGIEFPLMILFSHRVFPDSNRDLTVLIYAIAFALPSFYFYGKMLSDALSDKTLDRIGPMGTRIEGAGEFNAARKLAQRGDIEGAVIVYRGYRDNRSGALLEAARLLRTEERYADAVNMFQEISERYTDNKVVWAEATYSLAKIMETNLGQPIGAMQYLQQIRKRTPESKYAQMANSDLNRLQVMTGTRLEDTEGAPDLPKEDVGSNYLNKVQVPLKYDRENVAQDLLDAPIPERDPFLSRDIYTQRGAKIERKDEPIHRAVVKKSTAKKKSVAKKTTPIKLEAAPVKTAAVAKKKPAAKKKAVVRGASMGKGAAAPKAKAKPKAKVSSVKAAVKKAAPAKKKAVAKKKAK